MDSRIHDSHFSSMSKAKAKFNEQVQLVLSECADNLAQSNIQSLSIHLYLLRSEAEPHWHSSSG